MNKEIKKLFLKDQREECGTHLSKEEKSKEAYIMWLFQLIYDTTTYKKMIDALEDVALKYSLDSEKKIEEVTNLKYHIISNPNINVK